VSGGLVEPNAIRLRAIARYVRRRPFGDPFLKAMIEPTHVGALEMLPTERRDALRADAMLRRLGVRCLWRAAIVTEQLRDAGVAAHVGITVSSRDPRRAHAECEVHGEPIRPYRSDSVRLR
jgi:hypothetical protein